VNEDFGKYLGATKKGGEVIEINASLRQMCKQRKMKYIDVYTHLVAKESGKLDPKFTNDGLHLLGEGYIVWKSILDKYINEK
jgi:lysophospholipase L1-like esterase